MTDANDKVSRIVDSVTSSLLVRLRGGDSQAWQRFTYVYGPLVLSWCRWGGVRDDAALDISQEVFAVVARKIGDFRRDSPGDSMTGWMRTITSNKVKDFFRKRAKQPHPEGGSDAFLQLQQIPDGSADSSLGRVSPETAILARQIVEFVRGQFSEISWKAFYGCVVNGQKPADVAEELGLNRNQVYLAKSRILQRLRAEYGSIFEAPADQREVEPGGLGAVTGGPDPPA